MTTVKNAASWKLNAAEKKELADRVSHGEDESTVKRELQNKKAQASADRKAAAAAVAAKCALQSTKAAASKAKAKAKNKAAAANAASAASAPSGALEEEQLNDAANKAYYCQVLEDCQLVLSEFGEDFRKEGPLAITGAGDATSGVQEPFDRSKAQTALSVHGCYRASISVLWINPLASPTPGVPMSRRRVEDLAAIMVLKVSLGSDCDTDRPSGLQIVSPEGCYMQLSVAVPRLSSFLDTV